MVKIERQPNTEYILSLSYGKDSMACLGAIEKLGLPLDRIITAEVWATDNIEADLPPMVEFKAKADKIIKERYGVEVEHYYATKDMGGGIEEKFTFERYFYMKRRRGNRPETIFGFPMVGRGNCYFKKFAKIDAMKKIKIEEGINVVQYIGIAEDEPERLERLDNLTKISPLHLIGWTEQDAMNWCKQNDLLSPIYEDIKRDGCWFCPNQHINTLRNLKNNYPELWELMLKWDNDCDVKFHADGHTVHDYDRRFTYEDLGTVPKDRKFRWKMLDNVE